MQVMQPLYGSSEHSSSLHPSSHTMVAPVRVTASVAAGSGTRRILLALGVAIGCYMLLSMTSSWQKPTILGAACTHGTVPMQASDRPLLRAGTPEVHPHDDNSMLSELGSKEVASQASESGASALLPLPSSPRAASASCSPKPQLWLPATTVKVISTDEDMDAVIKGYSAPVGRSHAADGSMTSSSPESHAGAEDPAMLFFTVVDLTPRPVEESTRSNAAEGYTDSIVNWDLSIQLAFASPAVRARRLIVATNNDTCNELSLRGVPGCVVDLLTPLRFEPAARPPADFRVMGGVVTYKYYWTKRALALGVQVLYTDVDVIFRRGMDPLDKLLLAPRRLPSPSGAAWPPIPDLQLLSDHAEARSHANPLISEPVPCNPSFQVTLNALAHSTLDWRSSLYTTNRRAADGMQSHLVSSAAPQTVHEAVRDFVGLECEAGGMYTPKPASCFSTGFWLAQPTNDVRAVFDRTINTQIDRRPKNWEQEVFNRDLPSSVDVLFPNITVVVLDPRLAGNVWEQQCALSMNLTGAVASLPQPAAPVFTHFGYVRGQNKRDTMLRHGIWYVPAPANQSDGLASANTTASPSAAT